VAVDMVGSGVVVVDVVGLAIVVVCGGGKWCGEWGTGVML